MSSPSLLSLLWEVHQDEDGTVSLETVLVIAAIALPVLIFLYKFVWPRLQEWFWERASDVGVTPGGNAVP